MEFPVTAREMTVLLRRRNTFWAAGLFYGLLALGFSITWVFIGENYFDRESASRVIFNLYLAYGYVFLSFHAILTASHSIVSERESRSSGLLRACPLTPTWLVVQKLLTPLLLEWFFFLGTLPFLSLVFLLGGIGLGEFIHQMVNLAVWLTTAVMLGLAASSRALSSSRSDRNAFWFVIILALLIPWFSSATAPLKSAYGEVLAIPFWILETISLLSPFWMVVSWENTVAGAGAGPWSSSLPALPAWIGHLVLDLILLAVAIRGWKRTPDEAQVVARPWLKIGRRRKASSIGKRWKNPYPTGWRAFKEFERRATTKYGNAGTYFAVLLYIIFLFLLVIVITSYPNLGLPSFIVSPLCLGFSLIVFFRCFGSTSNAFRRERNRETAVFLLYTPVFIRDIALGKWLYYLSKIFLIVAVGLSSCFLLLILAGGSQTSFEDLFVGFLVAASCIFWIPLLSLIGLISGLYARMARYGVVMVIGFFCCSGYCLTPIIVPVLMIIAAIFLFAVQYRSLPEKETSGMTVVRLLAGSALVAILLIDGAVLLITLIDVGLTGFLTAFYKFISLKGVISHILLTLNLTIIPLCLAVTVWVWLVSHSYKWWRAKLLVKET